MDTQALRWFQMVADGITVTDVSSMEHATQSGVSRSLARLEAEVGTPLLRRTGRTLRMTRAGVAFKRHVDMLMHELDDGLAAVQQLLDPETGTVTLSFQPSLGSWLVPDLVSGFRAEHPRVQFDLRPKRDELVTTTSAHGEIDLELSTLRPQDAGVRWRRLARQALLLAVPAEHRLASRTAVALADVADEPFITIRTSSLLRHQSDELCDSAGVRPEVAFECDDIVTMSGFVAAGLGVAVVPASPGTAADDDARRLRLLPISDPGAVRDVGVTWSPERRMLPAAELFRVHVVDRAAAGWPSGLTS
ncbi:LysR substrate-binding domain-containing protein [Cellulomonas sp. ATA003]|uniref:LysR substrate-binding domain-containing protein n=1 Tax=Cellulomonas sp. ATA003 TaxID=3073064 RepID=UPI0028730E20|nr:LysR substrate-binding domain-containing protein [Cellulomonas sp. ATA003]WNB84664.1 LysR substrate-binding domain-containing protein [Cellulomonas sp. ATA003]